MDYLPLFFTLMFVVVVIFWFGLMIIIGDKAGEMGRSSLFWIFFSLFASPVIGLALLHFAGKTRDKRIQDVKEDEYYRTQFRNKKEDVTSSASSSYEDRRK